MTNQRLGQLVSAVAHPAPTGQAITVQIGTVHIEPSLGALGFRIEPLHQAPEPRRMVQLHEMAHLVRGKVVEHEGRRENEAPGERQHARIGTRAPTARLITYVDALDRNAQRGRITAAGCLEIALRLALQKVADAAVDMRRLAGDAEHALAAFIDLRPRRAARARPVDDTMWLTAQRHIHPLREGRRLRQPLPPASNPPAVLLRELLCLLETASRRHGENHLAQGGIDTQRVAPRLAMTTQTHGIDRLVEYDLDDRGLARTPIEQGAKRH